MNSISPIAKIQVFLVQKKTSENFIDENLNFVSTLLRFFIANNFTVSLKLSSLLLKFVNLLLIITGNSKTYRYESDAIKIELASFSVTADSHR